MSVQTLSDLKYVTREELAETLQDPEESKKIAVVDVRDDDHVGGHIASSLWAPYQQINPRLPELVRRLQDKQRVIFHCALSQQRGPSAALKYARERRHLLNLKDEHGAETDGGQEICVLQGGFVLWQAKYGPDERLTREWVRDVWDE
ncbi:MAG: hypothetical protein Q9227_007200 [Pyrenula ochraceoflavens]